MEQFAIDPILLDRFQRLGVALAVGLLVGIERGWKEREAGAGERTAGIRTFALIGLLGGASAIIGAELGGVVAAAAFLGFALVIGAFELQGAKATDSRDATPVVAALVVFALGAVAGVGFLRAAAAAAVATTMLLALKSDIHRWLEKITFEELRAGLLLGVMTVILLPLLPAEPIDPWDAISLRAVWLMTIFISAVSFTGYAAIRIAGPGRGPIVAGLAGGLVSSTATAVSFSRMAKRAKANESVLVAGMLAANAVMFARLGVVASALRPQLVAPLIFALIPAIAVSALLAFVMHLRAVKHDKTSPQELELKNPLDLTLALQFGVLLAAISLAATWLEQLFGAR
ncbi:MAG: MgtC/SapB family protein, partial [Maricaulaceae bacterium]